jgi:hypothetical protein
MCVILRSKKNKKSDKTREAFPPGKNKKSVKADPSLSCPEDASLIFCRRPKNKNAKVNFPFINQEFLVFHAWSAAKRNRRVSVTRLTFSIAAGRFRLAAGRLLRIVRTASAQGPVLSICNLDR